MCLIKKGGIRPRRLVSKAFSACKIPDHFSATWGEYPSYTLKWSGILQLRKKYQAPRTNRIEKKIMSKVIKNKEKSLKDEVQKINPYPSLGVS
ncbi:hypothetical protein DRJ79_13880 [Enterococcus faecalis]|nr:hypothetical protein DRJ74_13710 [Enterococcus faecalis]RTK84698.1 hypothetical protein DRJ79_13880 [Enterococcus faecalis]